MGTRIKLSESQHVTEVYDVTVTTASTSSVATATLTFDQVFANTPDVLSCYVNDGVKNKLMNNCSAASVTPTSLQVYLHGDITLTDSTVSVRVVLHGRL